MNDIVIYSTGCPACKFLEQRLKDKHINFTINNDDLSLGSGSGTFELYPTKNMYQFILLDKVTGRQWHIQWGMEASKRWIRRFY